MANGGKKRRKNVLRRSVRRCLRAGHGGGPRFFLVGDLSKKRAGFSVEKCGRFFVRSVGEERIGWSGVARGRKGRIFRVSDNPLIFDLAEISV